MTSAIGENALRNPWKNNATATPAPPPPPFMNQKVTIYRAADQSQHQMEVMQAWRALESGALTENDYALAPDNTWQPIASVLSADGSLVNHPSSPPQRTMASSRKEYRVELLHTGFFSGTLNPIKLQDSLNAAASAGWRFARSIQEHRRMLFFFSREAHFLIFERDA